MQFLCEDCRFFGVLYDRARELRGGLYVNRDEMLVRESLAGDDTAFGVLVDRHKAAVYGIARRKLGNHTDAEDVTQEVFLKAYQNLGAFRRPYNFSGWLYTITVNCCRDRMRRMSRSAKHEVPIDRVRPQALEEKAAESYQDDELKRTVRSVIAELSESDQQVLTLHYMHGLTCKEIGRYFGTSARAKSLNTGSKGLSRSIC